MKRYFALEKNGGFTLIELLVVIAIIGILVAIIAVSVYLCERTGEIPVFYLIWAKLGHRLK